MKLTQEERQRAVVYKKMAEVKGWEKALKTRYHHWRGLSAQNRADPYLTGRADSWEELIALIEQAHAIQIQGSEEVHVG